MPATEVDLRYNTDEAGDIATVTSDGVTQPFDPSTLGWLKPGGANDPGRSNGLTPADIERLPDFTMARASIEFHLPGPKALPNKWRAWRDTGAAPPAAVETTDGSTAYYDRLTDALGMAVQRARRITVPSTFLVFDFVAGEQFTLNRDPEVVLDEGETIYFIDDGYAIKIGRTSRSGQHRIRDLQTGNPRTLSVLAEVLKASIFLEDDLWKAAEEVGARNLRGEWFEREPLLEAMRQAGGTKVWLESLGPVRGLDVVVYQP